MRILKGSVFLRLVEKIRKLENRNFIHWLVSMCSSMFNSYMKKYQCSKLNTYLVTINLSFKMGVLCLHWKSIEIKPSSNIQSPEKIWAQWCYIFLNTFVNIERPNQLTLYIWNCNIHALISKSNNSTCMNCTGILSVCVSPMWPYIMNINSCNT